MSKQYILMAFAAILFCFTACEEDTFGPVLTLGDAPALTAPAANTSFVITDETVDGDLATFTWSPAEFGFPAATVYTVEADLAGNNFADPINLIQNVNATTGTVSNSTVNNFLASRDIVSGVAQDIEVRVRAVVGEVEDNNILISAPVTLNVTSLAERDYPFLFVPGAHQGWDPPSAPMIFDIEDDNTYNGFVYFAMADNAFKFTDSPNWDNGNYGDNDGDGVIDDAGGNIVAGDAGMYRLNVDLNDRTYTVEATNWGLIGSATPTGTDADTDLTYDAAAGVLTITTDLTVGEIKFRANDANDINLGDNGANGSLEYNGDNIAITEAGNYTISLLLNQAIYGYTLVKN